MMNKFLLIFATVISTTVFAQKKVNFSSVESLLKRVEPDQNISSWVLLASNYGAHKEVKTFGNKIDYDVQPNGFQLEDKDDQYYYFAYLDAGVLKYVTEKSELKNLYGRINNASEAALFLLSEGYFLDKEFKELGANYIETNTDFLLELSKITSEKCPYAKHHFQITVDKKTGSVTNTKDNGVYFEVFDKSCANNPRYDELEQQIDAAKLKKEEEALKNKEAKAKMKKKLQKSMRNN